VTIMGGPQLRAAIAVSKAIRERAPAIPIIWGGAFPTNCPQAALNTSYVDYAVRGQGEETLLSFSMHSSTTEPKHGIDLRLSRRLQGEIIHNTARVFSAASLSRRLPYERLENPAQYLSRTYLGQRPAGYQAALGCRYRCTFCGVAQCSRQDGLAAGRPAP